MSQDIPPSPVEMHPLKGQLDRAPLAHPSHALHFAPWPWTDLDDGWFFCPGKHICVGFIIVLIRLTEVDPMQLETVKFPVPEHCDHSYESCNNCWKGYPQSLFPNWTQRQLKKAKIYEVIQNYSKIKPCIYYQVDVNDRGLFTNSREIITTYGDEDKIWDNLVHERVSCISIICEALPEKKKSFRDHLIHD